MTTHVATVDWSFTERPFEPSPRWEGLARSVLVGAEQGAVHTELAVGSLAPGGWLNRHFHSFEEALYVLDGELLLEIDGHHHRLVKGDFALMPVGTWHALANAGSEPNRFFRKLSADISVVIYGPSGSADRADATPIAR